VYFGFALAIVCGLAILAFVIADAFAFARVRTVASADLEQRDPSEARYVTDVPAVDLGLGDDVAAKMERAKSAYRGKDRALGLLWGSVSAARRALAFSMARGVLGLAVVAAVLAGHRFSTTPAARVEYQAQRCKSSIPSCYTAASLLQSEPGITPDPVRAEALLRRGCEAGEKRACDALYRSSLSGSLPYWYVPSP
jgi:hypothetical protein